VRNRLKI